ncbi:MAG: type II 3-dehydroquinate dehydratase [Flavobacteriaceae bacterium]
MGWRVDIVNGPNLNRLGTREPGIYGRATLADIEAMCRAAWTDGEMVFRQSNAEAEIVGFIHEAVDAADAVVINPAGLTFTSVPLVDALKMFPGPVIEVHLSNIHAREKMYHRSLVSPVASGVVAGFGAQGYLAALGAARDLLSRP